MLKERMSYTTRLHQHQVVECVDPTVGLQRGAQYVVTAVRPFAWGSYDMVTVRPVDPRIHHPGDSGFWPARFAPAHG